MAALWMLTLGVAAPAMAEEGGSWPRGHYPLPEEGDVIGDVYSVTVEAGQTLLDIARQHKVGYEEIRRANPGVSLWVPRGGEEVVVPAQRILPSVHREGIVINIAELRLYYYPHAGDGETPRVETYPIGIGRAGYDTPLGKTQTGMRLKDPAWYPPESVRREAAERGDPPPEVVPPGPDNPLGSRAIMLDIPGYLIHGTNRPDGIGMRASRGCIRMLPEDIESIFERVPEGTLVNIIDQPIKVGWHEGVPHVQAYQPLEEQDNALVRLIEAMALLERVYPEEPAALNYAQLRGVVDAPTGQVVAIRPAPKPEPEPESEAGGVYRHLGLQRGFLDAMEV